MSAFTIQTAIQVHRGNAELQDQACVAQRGAAGLLVVADGAGGRSHAREAAERALRTIRELASESVLLSSGEACGRLLTLADEDVIKTGGETTGVFAVVTRDCVAGASVGDSEAWIVDGAEVCILTKAQYRKPFLGTGAALPVAFRKAPWKGTLLLASDGLFKYTSREAITKALANPDLAQAATRLIELVRYPSGELPDDVSVVLARPA